MSLVGRIICKFVTSYAEVEELRGNPLFKHLCLEDWKVCTDNGRIVRTGRIIVYDADTGKAIYSFYDPELREDCYGDP
jgi:hypothetical protein